MFTTSHQAVQLHHHRQSSLRLPLPHLLELSLQRRLEVVVLAGAHEGALSPLLAAVHATAERPLHPDNPSAVAQVNEMAG